MRYVCSAVCTARAFAFCAMALFILGTLGCSASAPPQTKEAVESASEDEESAPMEQYPVVLLDDEQQPNAFMGVRITNLTRNQSYIKGRGVLLAFEMLNNSNEPVDLYFPEGQVFDFAVFDHVQEIWRYSRHRTFGGTGRMRTVRSGEGEAYRVMWDQVDNYGRSVPEGLYIVRGYLMAEPVLMTEEVDIVIAE